MFACAALWAAPPCRADAPAATTTAAPAAATAEGPTGAAAVAAAKAKLAQGDVDGALSTLAAVSGPLRLEDELLRWETLGIARGDAGDAKGAEEAFRTLLVLAPGWALPYTLSPKATFPFERARKSLAGVPALSLVVDAPRAPPFDKPIEVRIERAGDPLKLVATVELCARAKGADAAPSCRTLAAPPVGGFVDVDLPPLARPPGDAPGAYLQLSLLGKNAGGSEVWRGPAPDRPLELAVGFEQPAPWYASPWLWGSVAAGAAVVAGSSALVALAAARTPTAQLHYTVKDGT